MVRNSFNAANKIKSIPLEGFDDGYIFASFNVESLFTSITLDGVYNNKLTATQLKNQTSKKLLKDTCGKTVFSTNDKLYQYTDGVSICSSLGPLLVNIIVNEMEKTIIKKFIDDKILLFYGCCVDDTLVITKREYLKLVPDDTNSFDRNLNFTFDTFDNVVPLFLNIEIHPDGLIFYCKDTNTGQCTHYNSFFSMALQNMVALHRTVNICDKNKLQAELTRIQDLIAWNRFPNRIGDAIINNKLKRLHVNNIKNSTNNYFDTIWIKIP